MSRHYAAKKKVRSLEMHDLGMHRSPQDAAKTANKHYVAQLVSARR